MSGILVFGATSAIAQAAARIFAARGERLHLVGRDAAKLAVVAEDLRVRGAAAVTTAAADLDDCTRHAQLLEEGRASLGALDVVLVAQGVLPDQRECERSASATRAALLTNFLAPAALLGEAAAMLEAQQGGVLVAISSVAGDRGRKSNYVYGAAKGGLALFLEGLASRLRGSGVHVVTVKPGFVDTPMTATFRKGLLWASAESVGRGIVRAVDRRAHVVYLPWFWRPVMWGLRQLPRALFERLPI